MSYKVCHLTTVHRPFDVRIFHKECKSLLQAGYDVTLIAQHEKDEVIDGIKIKALPKIENRVKRILNLPWIALRKALEENADVYHFHDPELIPIGLVLKVKGKKVIYDIHEDVPRQILGKPYLNKLSASIVSCLFERFEDFSVRFFDALIVATPCIASRFLRLNNCTVNVNNYPLLDELAGPSNWEKRTNAIAYIGGISKTRGVVELVKALEYIDTVLHLAGNFDDQQLEEKLKSLPGWRKVIYYGYIDRTRVCDILHRVKVGVVTLHPTLNYFEGLPIKLFEYMSAGIPVVASNFPLWKEIVEGNNCGICVDPLKPKEIADAIRYLLEHSEEAKEMGENGRKAVEEKYNWETESKKLLQVYRELLQEDQTEDYRPNLITKRILHFL
ncbi:MAG TPA: glycosyltransferase family 4 protein [Clostridiales bacterium]|nr:glycosyltransferase family 4 protein [Clostridiales bacterium]